MNKRLAISCATAAWLALSGFEAKLHAQSPADPVSSSSDVVIKNFIPDMDIARRLEEAKEKTLQAAKAAKAATPATSATKHAASEQNSLPPLASHLKASKSDTPREVVSLDKKAGKPPGPGTCPGEVTSNSRRSRPASRPRVTVTISSTSTTLPRLVSQSLVPLTRTGAPSMGTRMPGAG